MPWTVKKDETSAFLLISYNFSGPCIRFMFSGYIFSVCLIDIISGYLIDIFYRVCVLTVCMRMLSRLASSILRHSLGLASHAIIVFSIVAITWTPPPPPAPPPPYEYRDTRAFVDCACRGTTAYAAGASTITELLAVSASVSRIRTLP